MIYNLNPLDYCSIPTILQSLQSLLSHQLYEIFGTQGGCIKANICLAATKLLKTLKHYHLFPSVQIC